MTSNPLKAIREKCIDCCCGSLVEVKECTAEHCALFPYRFGKNPYRKRREITEEQKQVLADRLAEARKNNSNSV